MSIITVASTKGGVGKSTFITNLATILTELNYKVAVLDADYQGTTSKWNNIREFLRNESKLSEIFVVSARGEALLDIANIKKEQGYIVLIDSPGVDDVNMRNALLRSDFIITICSASPVDLWEVETLINILKKLKSVQVRKIPLIFIFNRISTRHSEVAINNAHNFFDQNNIFPDHILSSIIKERVVFKNAMRDGKGVIEYLPLDNKAVEEFELCCNEVLDIISSYK